MTAWHVAALSVRYSLAPLLSRAPQTLYLTLDVYLNFSQGKIYSNFMLSLKSSKAIALIPSSEVEFDSPEY